MVKKCDDFDWSCASRMKRVKKVVKRDVTPCCKRRGRPPRLDLNQSIHADLQCSPFVSTFFEQAWEDEILSNNVSGIPTWRD